MSKYLIVGGNPIAMPRGGTAYTGLDVIGKADTKAEAADVFRAQYDNCSGLLVVIDTETGAAADMEGV